MDHYYLSSFVNLDCVIGLYVMYALCVCLTLRSYELLAQFIVMLLMICMYCEVFGTYDDGNGI